MKSYPIVFAIALLAGCGGAANESNEATDATNSAEDLTAGKAYTCTAEYDGEDLGYTDGFSLKITAKTATIRDLQADADPATIKGKIDSTYKPTAKYKGYERYDFASSYDSDGTYATFELIVKPGAAKSTTYIRRQSSDGEATASFTCSR